MLLASTFGSCRSKNSVPIATNNDYASLFQLKKIPNRVVVQTKDLTNKVISSVEIADKKSFKRVVLLNTPYCAYVSKLNVQASVVGIAAFESLNSNVLGFDEDSIVNVGEKGVLNLEKIQALQPDLIICSSYQVQELSLITSCPVLIVNEFWEQHPLAKAEWLKLFGALFNEVETANELFKEIESEYLKNIQSATSKLKVMNVQQYGAHYYTPGCESLLNQLLNDAGVVVNCDGEGSKSKELSKEQVLMYSLELDALLYFSTNDKTRKEVLEELAIRNFKGKVLLCNTVKTGYFEEAVLHPDQLLKELKSCIHAQDNKGKYFKEL